MKKVSLATDGSCLGNPGTRDRVCPQKDLAEYESNFRYSSRTIPAVRCLKPYCGGRAKQPKKETITKRSIIRHMFTVI